MTERDGVRVAVAVLVREGLADSVEVAVAEVVADGVVLADGLLDGLADGDGVVLLVAVGETDPIGTGVGSGA